MLCRRQGQGEVCLQRHRAGSATMDVHPRDGYITAHSMQGTAVGTARGQGWWAV